MKHSLWPFFKSLFLRSLLFWWFWSRSSLCIRKPYFETVVDHRRFAPLKVRSNVRQMQSVINFPAYRLFFVSLFFPPILFLSPSISSYQFSGEKWNEQFFTPSRLPSSVDFPNESPGKIDKPDGTRRPNPPSSPRNRCRKWARNV